MLDCWGVALFKRIRRIRSCHLIAIGIVFLEKVGFEVSKAHANFIKYVWDIWKPSLITKYTEFLYTLDMWIEDSLYNILTDSAF